MQSGLELLNPKLRVQGFGRRVQGAGLVSRRSGFTLVFASMRYATTLHDATKMRCTVRR